MGEGSELSKAHGPEEIPIALEGVATEWNRNPSLFLLNFMVSMDFDPVPKTGAAWPGSPYIFWGLEVEFYGSTVPWVFHGNIHENPWIFHRFSVISCKGLGLGQVFHKISINKPYNSMEFPTTWISLISYGVQVFRDYWKFSHKIPDLMEGELCFRAFKAWRSLMGRGVLANPKFHIIPKIL